SDRLDKNFELLSIKNLMFSRLMSINNHLYWLITTYTGPPNLAMAVSSTVTACGLDNADVARMKQE
ncbi:MAG: hypothetical protein MGF17_14135, partial [Trichodesmium sp. MAG_R04]|nr:hypothetical protein [Trichodesmium sp. MAG_R04]